MKRHLQSKPTSGTIRPMTRVPDHALLSRCLVVALIGALSGCSSATKFILDSDVPTPEHLDGRLLNGLKREDGRLVGAHAIYVGNIANAQASLARVEMQFTKAGWVLERAAGDEIKADGFFLKDTRSCRVRVLKNELDPAMSRMSYELGGPDG